MKRQVVGAIFLCLAVSGCANAARVEREEKAKAASAEFVSARSQCGSRYPSAKDAVSRANCINDATQIIRQYLPYPDLLDQENAARLLISEQIAGGKITPAEGGVRFAKMHSDVVAEEQRRTLAGRAVSAQERTAAAAWRASDPVSCTKYGNTVSCF